MSRATKNLTKPQAVRLRHNQMEKLERIISTMTEKELNQLKEKDRGKFKHPEFFKNTGQPANPKLLIMREALDLWIERYQQERTSRENPGLFDGLEEK